METMSVETAPPKMSFAKVAASAHQLHIRKENIPASSAAPKALHKASLTRSREARSSPAHDTLELAQNRGINGSQSRTGILLEQRRVIMRPHGTGDAHGLPTLLKAIHLDDHNATQLPTSDSSIKPASGDEKSVTSGTTFALDEKESLRPDDSASVKAAAEENDAFSPSGSAPPGSRIGSDTGAEAFQDQLHVIARTGPLPFPELSTRKPQTESLPLSGSAFYPAPPTSNAVNEGQPTASFGPAPAQLPLLPPYSLPDEKLFEALASPTDRLFVMKLEQDIIDFVKYTSDQTLNLPQCNSFYRLLAHRLADYYALGHVLDPTQSAVQLHRTPFCKLPPRLSDLPNPFSDRKTPPPVIPARKIMRRGDEDTSKTTSETGGDSASDEGRTSSNGKKETSSMTREEREARYNAARHRIFKDFKEKEADASDTAAAEQDGKGVSRTSSFTGKKKLRKQRNIDDDDFEARSRFSPYYPPTNSNSSAFPGFSIEPHFSDTYQVPAISPQNSLPGVSYFAPLQQMSVDYSQTPAQEAPGSHSWNAGQYGEANMTCFAPPDYGQMTSGSYDLTNVAQPGFQSFQSHGVPSQFSPMSVAMQGACDSSYGFVAQGTGQGWPHMFYEGSFGYCAPSMDNGTFLGAPLQANQNGPVAYGQIPNQAFSNGMSETHYNHPIPGSYQRPIFNPQSQDFVPAGYMRHAASPQHLVNGAAGAQASFPLQRQDSSHSQSSALGSRHVPQSSPASNRMGGHNISRNHASNGQAVQSSISKWGTPAHLPPKPPPSTAPMQVPMHRDSQHALPPHVPPANGRFARAG